MFKNEIIQYLSLTRYKPLNKIINNLNQNNISIILDMEDSAQDLFNTANNSKLKQICRDGIKYLSNTLNNLNNDFYIRINSLRDKNYEMDIQSINRYINKDNTHFGVFLPKVESYSDVLKLKDDLKDFKTKIIIISETVKGLENLSSILAQDNINLIQGVHYGHFDYCYDADIWPFTEPFHFEYWDKIFQILKILKKSEKIFIQTPYPLLNNSNFFWSSYKHIKENFPEQKFLMSLVNYNKNLLKKPKEILPLKLKKVSNNKEFQIKFSKKIINLYNNLRSRNKSFTLDNKRFIPPHQFLMAEKFYKNNK